jgi:hypothetical protein
MARVMQQSGPPLFLEVDPISWTGLSYVDELSKPQQLNAGCQVASLTESVKQRLRDLAHQPTEIWLYRNGKIVFAGPLLGFQRQGQALTLNALGILKYLDVMFVTADTVFSQKDQFTIAKTLIDNWQVQPYGNFGIDTSGVGASGVLRDATYLQTELDGVGPKLSELGARQNGFDFTVDPASRKLLLSYPLQGVDRSSGPDAIVFDSRNVTSENILCSVAPGDVASIAFGTGTSTTANGVTLYSTQSNSDLIAQFGRAGVAQNFDGVSIQATLDDHTLGLLNARKIALLIPGPDTLVTPDADLSQWDVGDTLSYQLDSTLGVTGAFRSRKRQVTVSKTGKETCTIDFS